MDSGFRPYLLYYMFVSYGDSVRLGLWWSPLKVGDSQSMIDLAALVISLGKHT